MNVMTEASVYEVYYSMSDGEKQHMLTSCTKMAGCLRRLKRSLMSSA